MIHFRCLNVTYERVLPFVSIVICYYNEHLMTLIRSVNSILQRTSIELVKEIILVDDCSDEAPYDIKKELYKIDKWKLVKVLRNSNREGLIRYIKIKKKLLSFYYNLN